jgi:hypothetical protein
LIQQKICSTVAYFNLKKGLCDPQHFVFERSYKNAAARGSTKTHSASDRFLRLTTTVGPKQTSFLLATDK